MWYRLSEEKHILYNRTSETTDIDRADLINTKILRFSFAG
jgi:hypothetical protein